MKLNLSKKQYIKFYLKYANPKIILTAIDNSHTFLELKDYIDPKIKTISIQNGYRTYWGDLLDLKKKVKNRKKKFKVDLMFIFNEKIKNIYNEFISGEKIIIGAYANNDRKKLKNKKKNEVLFISTHKPYENSTYYEGKVSSHDFYKDDKKALISVLENCKKNNLKLNILGRIKSNNEIIKEYEYFRSILGSNFNFIKNQEGKNNHFLLDKYKYVITIDSTLGVENLSRGGRTIFISSRPKRFPATTRSYGNMEGFGSNGNFWCHFTSKKNINKIFSNLVKKDDNFWRKCIKKNRESIMKYDPKNSIFNKKLKKYLKFDTN